MQATAHTVPAITVEVFEEAFRVSGSIVRTMRAEENKPVPNPAADFQDWQRSGSDPRRVPDYARWYLSRTVF